MKMYPGMVALKNRKSQQPTKNLVAKMEMLKAINPILKYEKEQREKVFLESQQ